MITDKVLDLLQAIAEFLLSLVPVPDSAPDPSGMSSGAAEITARSGWVAHWLPIGLAAWCAIAVLSWSLTCWAISVIFTLARRVRLSG